MNKIKITVYAYNNIWKFDTFKYCGYIKCDRLKKVFPISVDAIPHQSAKGNSFICECGNFTHEDIWYHKLFYKGKDVQYGYN